MQNDKSTGLDEDEGDDASFADGDVSKSRYGTGLAGVQRTKEWAMQQQTGDGAQVRQLIDDNGTYQFRPQDHQIDPSWNQDKGPSHRIPEQVRDAGNRPSVDPAGAGRLHQMRSILKAEAGLPPSSRQSSTPVPSHPVPQYAPTLDSEPPYVETERTMGRLRLRDRNAPSPFAPRPPPPPPPPLDQVTTTNPTHPLPGRRSRNNRMPRHVRDIFQEHRHLVNSYNTRPDSPERFAPRRYNEEEALQTTSNTTTTPSLDRGAAASSEVEASLSNAMVLATEAAVTEAAPVTEATATEVAVHAELKTTSDDVRRKTPTASSPLLQATLPLPTLPATNEGDEDEDEEVVVYRGRPKRDVSSQSNPNPGADGGASVRS